MSFNPTVNGKPAKPCGKPIIFDDAEQRRKECLAQKRKQRILQVREQSKEIARKLRNDVAAEKERQQRVLNEKKARELQIWHADAMARAQHNYAACFAQIGAAQYAAKLENEQRAAMAKMRAQQRYCPHVGRPHNNSNRWPLRSCLKKHTMCTQTEYTLPITEKDKSKRCSPERASKVFIKDNECRCCPVDSDDDADDDDDESSDIFKDSCDISSSDSATECETVKKTKCNETVIRAGRLCKTPAVVLAVDLDCNDVVTITTPGEIKDNFPQNNRQFSSVIRVSPRSKHSGKCDPCKCRPVCCPPCSEKTSSDNTCTEQTSSDTIATKSTNTLEVATKSTSTTEFATKATSITGIEGRGSKRFTQVSDLIGKKSSKATQMNGGDNDNTKITQTDYKRSSVVSNVSHVSHTPKLLSKSGYPSNFSLFASSHKIVPENQEEPSTSKPVQKQTSNIPRDSTASRATTGSKPRDSAASRTKKTMPKESAAVPPPKQPPSPRKEIPSPKTSAKSSLLKNKPAPRKSADSVSFQRSNSNDNDRQLSGRDCLSNNSMPVDDCVQFFDYNNKYTKAYEQPCNAVKLQPHIRTEPNAMQQARFEKQMRGTRIEKMSQLRKLCEERGQKALEREQVRRDCTELTEKLEALSKQHVPLVPTDSKIIGSHQFVDMATRKQAKMNAIMEEMLMRPAIITCPEVACPEVIPQEAVSSSTSKGKSKQPITCLNLGDTPPTNEGSDPSSDSCRSILLGYVNDQSKQIRNDISQYKTNPLKNEEKSKRLNDLLERIDQLRDALKNELETGTSSSDVHNVQEVIDSISNVRKERERILIDNITEEAIVPLQQREKKMQQKEAAKEKEKQERKKDMPTTSGGTKAKTTNESNEKSGKKPLEIIIKVSGAHIKRTGANAKKSNVRTQGQKVKSPRKVSTLTRSPVKTTAKKSTTQKKPQTSTTEKVVTAINSAAAATASNIQLDLNTDDSDESSNPPTNVAAQSSYDSNSTAYRSLPTKVTNNVDKVLDKIPSQSKPAVDAANDEPATDESANQQAPKQSHRQQSAAPPPRLNPLIAHYVQRLLGMSRNSINTLGVSTSEVDTPSSSIINTTANKPEMEEEALLSRERIDRVQSFIDENHRLIYELEESLRVSNISENALESSMKAFEIIWKQQLMESEKRKRRPAAAAAAVQTTNSQTILENNEKVLKRRIESQKNRDQMKKSTEAEGKEIDTETAQRSRSKTKLQDAAVADMEGGDVQNAKISSTRRKEPSPARQEDNRTQKSKMTTTEEGDVDVDPRQKQNVRFPKHIDDSVKVASKQTGTDVAISLQAAQQQMGQGKAAQAEHKSKQQLIENVDAADSTQRCPDFERYAQLTNNCTHRIAELTQLINKVRKEKQKILESTLSSVSENERHSTEYMELPDAAPIGDGRSTSEPTTGRLLDSYLINETSAELSRNEKVLPLEKHKSTGRSRDSGISVSRPVTAQELLLDLDPSSLASNTNTSQASTRKPKPPPSLARFSPQLAEDELAHELSTIVEVDTPATSRLNATATQTLPNATPSLQHAYLRSNFPTFEQYIQTLNLDLTQIDAEQSTRIQQEFDELVAALTEAKRNRDLEYQEFPSISAYLQNITSAHERTGDGHRTLSETIPENIEDLLACLRLANLSIKSFPTQSEYVKRIATNSPEGDQLDSASLENFTLESGKDPSTESESINIEDELKRRNVLQSSFRRLSSRKVEQVLSSTVQSGADKVQTFPPMLIDESGIEKLSTSEAGTAELEKELLGIGLRWHTTMMKKIKETQALSSSSTTTTSTTLISATKNMPSAKNTPQAANSDSSASIPQKSDESTQEFGRPLNLRDFLTKELLKQNYTTSTSDSTTDESLRSNFFRSIIGTITPSCKPGQNSNTSNNQIVASVAVGDRQKTSTPVASHGTQTGSASNSSSVSISTQLFSGESRLSSVHF